MLNARELLVLAASALALAACGKKADTAAGAEADKPPTTTAGGDAVAAAEAAVPANPDRQAFFGAVHVHTGNSFDAYTNGTRTTPQDAYDWAQGKAITSSGFGDSIRIATPLDFYMVADHAEFMGSMTELSNPESALSKSELGRNIMSPDANTRLQTFAGILRDMSAGNPPEVLTDPALARTVWSRIVKAAEANYVPGRFTTFAGFEWTSNPKQRNLHRVVMFRDTKVLPEAVLSALASDDPETLWKWMGEQRAKGATLLAIPHNGNASDGRMFELVKFDGKPIDAAYNATRAENEPLYEITQIKGTSETWPSLSPNDEFAGFEQWNYTLSADYERPKNHRGSFIRQALLDGMAEEAAGRGNPFKYGYIGDTDTHNAAASHEEFNYTGKFAFENDPKHRISGVEGQPEGQVQQVREFSSGGIAGVWAEKNTRGAIYDAMLRKETFATSGPLMRVRFFAGWDLGTADLGERTRQGGLRARRADGQRPQGHRQGADLPGGGHEGPEEREPRPGADREGLARCVRQAAREGLRRGVVRRAQAGPGREAARGGQLGGPQDREVHQHHRGAGTRHGVDRPGVRPEAAGVLLRARAGDPDAALEHVRRGEAGGADPEGPGGHDPGAGLDVADLVHPDVAPVVAAP